MINFFIYVLNGSCILGLGLVLVLMNLGLGLGLGLVHGSHNTY